jgi:hypothetical protein
LSKSTTASPHSFFVAGAAGPFLKAYKNQNTNAIKTRTQSQIHQQIKRRRRRIRRRTTTKTETLKKHFEDL